MSSLTLSSLCSLCAQQSLQIWTPNEIEKFKKGLRTHGKNFPYIQSSSLKTKTLADLIEFYYYFKSTDAYKPIRAALKMREQLELKRTLEEGLLTCDHCSRTSTVEWHVGDDGQVSIPQYNQMLLDSGHAGLLLRPPDLIAWSQRTSLY
jgi:hypothetical protein